MLPFPMFPSTDPPTSRGIPSFSFTSSAATSSVSQSLPTFSTASKHATHSNARISTPFKRLVHSSLDTRGWGSPEQAKYLFSSPFCFPLSSPLTASQTPLLPFPRTTSTLTPVSATLTKKRGWGSSLLRASSAHSESLRYPLPFPDSPYRLVSPSLRRYLFASDHRIADLLPPQVHETHFSPVASHHMQAVPCGGSIQNQKSNTKYGGDCA